MKNFGRLLFILFILDYYSIIFCYSQTKSKIWLFGDKIGLDFKSSNPMPLLDVNPVYSNEGNVTITDELGNIFMFGAGNNIYNENLEIMKNGNDLLGNFTSSSGQSPIIAQLPGKLNLVYIFYISEHIGDYIGELRYSVINL